MTTLTTGCVIGNHAICSRRKWQKRWRFECFLFATWFPIFSFNDVAQPTRLSPTLYYNHGCVHVITFCEILLKNWVSCLHTEFDRIKPFKKILNCQGTIMTCAQIRFWSALVCGRGKVIIQNLIIAFDINPNSLEIRGLVAFLHLWFVTDYSSCTHFHSKTFC